MLTFNNPTSTNANAVISKLSMSNLMVDQSWAYRTIYGPASEMSQMNIVQWCPVCRGFENSRYVGSTTRHMTVAEPPEDWRFTPHEPISPSIKVVHKEYPVDEYRCERRGHIYHTDPACEAGGPASRPAPVFEFLPPPRD